MIAQDSSATISHRFTRLAFEVRADFDVHHHYPHPDSVKATDYGFNGKYFKTAPIFDNGKSFLIGNKRALEKDSLQEKIKCAYAKSFSPSFATNAKYLEKYCTLKIDVNCIQCIEKLGNEGITEILRYTLGI